MNVTAKAAPSAWPPLTHHEILALVEPFVRAGEVPDMAASDRAARRVALRPREVAAEGLGEPGLLLVESWEIEAHEPGEVRVVRRLAWPHGPCAELEGACHESELEALRAAMQAVPVDRQFVLAEARPETGAATKAREVQGVRPARAAGTGGSEGAAGNAAAVEPVGVVGALVQRVRLARSGGPEPSGAGPALVLRRAEARVGGLVLRWSLSGVGGYPAEVELLRGEGAAGSPRLPADLLAVLGRAWEPLTELGRGWVARVAVRGEEPRRSREARAAFERTLAHLATTLAEPPARFHARHRAARWRVVLRGTTPWLVGLALVGLALWARRTGSSSVLALLANVTPPLLMGLFFIRREMPRLALPRWPWPPGAQDWQPERGRAGSSGSAEPPAASPVPLQESA